MFKGLLGQLTQEEKSKYNRIHMIVKVDKHCQTCEENKQWAFNYSPIVRFMRDECNKIGADIQPSDVFCRYCPTPQFGGFHEDYGIILCQNELADRGRKKLEDVLAHEMVHAYDHLRFKMDRFNMKHMACTEIRASMLSGECRFVREFWGRKQYKITRAFQDCVKRRATLSMLNKRGLTDLESAKTMVDSVWDSCFRDTRPFDEVYK